MFSRSAARVGGDDDSGGSTLQTSSTTAYGASTVRGAGRGLYAVNAFNEGDFITRVRWTTCFEGRCQNMDD